MTQKSPKPVDSFLAHNISGKKSEILYGAENAVGRGVQFMRNVRKRMDIYFDHRAPSIVVDIEQYRNGYIDIRRRGGKIRAFTEITKENIHYCKELMKIVDELRHLDGVKGGMAVSESEYMATTVLEESKPLTEVIYSNVKEVVEQGQYIFDTLWRSTISGEQKIREIEEGKPPEKLEIIQDTRKSISRAFDIMNKTQKELLVLFATPRTFTLALQSGAADMYRKIYENGVDVKVLVPRDTATEENNEQIIAKVQEISPSINLRFSEVDLNTRITIMISDRNEFMSWELKDDTLDDPYLAGGIATYSNVKSLASSYAIIFDNLWKLTELAENLRIANIKLERNEKAMKEFINTAAHELRTPMQPILGLSEVIRDRILNVDKQLQSREKEKVVYKQLKDTATAGAVPDRSASNYSSSSPLSPSMEDIVEMANVLNRNAKRLEKLTSNLLDVSRIESGSLKLTMEKVDLDELIESIVHDFQRFLPADGKVTMNYQKLSNNFNENKEMSCLTVLGDPERIAQVLLNLFRNALKFTKEGTISVRVGRNYSPSSSEAIVYISDSGQGIDPEIMYRVFDKFVSKSEKGTGLGLFISKSIVEAHGGKIWAENNKDGKGAMFAFTLPLLKSQTGQDSKL